MVAAITLLLVTALPALAEQTSAESADFTVSTVPEPVAGALFIVGYSLFVMRRRKAMGSDKRHMGILRPIGVMHLQLTIVGMLTALLHSTMPIFTRRQVSSASLPFIRDHP